jgi:hypothetical protein
MYEGSKHSPVGEYNLFKRVLVLVKDPLPENISLSKCIEKIEKKIPEHLLHDLDSIYIGQFEEFVERDINAFYRDGAIFVTNDQADASDLTDDIIHEIAHSVEGYHKSQIYGDALLEREFLGKRRRLYDTMRQQDLDIDITRAQKLFFNLKYSSKFDNLLYKKVGYPLLASISTGLFNNPYAITSLREYFASGFEQYYMGDRMYLRKTCPQLYNKITELNEE